MLLFASFSCQVPCPTFEAEDDWSECSVRCGQGVQTRNVSCVSFDGRALDNSLCSGAQMPLAQRVCDQMPCPHWHRSDVSTHE